MTGTARIDSEMSGGNWFADTIRQASAQNTPAIAAMKPDSASADNFTVAAVTPNADAARSLSRTAITRRPGVDRRSARRPSMAATSTTRAR